MSIIRIADVDEIKPAHVVLVCVVAATLAGSCLLTSGPHREILHDGAVAWGPDSLLRAVVGVLNLQFTQTTAKGVEVKSLVFGLGASLAMLTLAFALGVRPRRGDEVSPHDTALAAAAADGGDLPSGPLGRKHVPLLVAAQVMMLAFALWSLASPAWSNAADFALGGAILLAIQLMWAFALGLGLNRVAARWAAGGMVVVCTLTAVLAIAYHGERNPTLRASYPIGNPLFLAACLIPGILIAAGMVIASVQSSQRRLASRVLPSAAGLLAMAVMLYAFYLTKSRGPLLGLIVGVAGMVFFAVRGRARLVVGLGAGVLLASAGWYLMGQRTAYSSTGRSASIRVRLHTWAYAFDLGVESPLAGHGQGGFALAGDAKAAGADVLADPLALNARADHAHNEWLEVWADLGSIGLVLVVGALVLTLWAGADALHRTPTPEMRWTLIALLAGLAGLVAEEATDVALRMPGLPAIYCTLIGLIWAMSAASHPAWTARLQSAAAGRVATFVVGAALAGAALVMTVRDFRGARAFYDVADSLNELQWDQAIALATEARDSRLDPADRVAAADRLCGTYLHVARVHQLEYFRQAAEARQADPPDERLSALAAQNRDLAVQYVQTGLGEVGELLKKAPAAWNTGLWEHGAYMILSELAGTAGDQEGQEAHRATAVAALEREINRRPFDPMLALSYADAQGAEVDLATLFGVLARPLRQNATPPGYLEMLTDLAAVPDFDTGFRPIHDSLFGVTPEVPIDQWPDPWVPEKLRLAAIILFARNLPDSAEIELTRAVALYDLIRESAPLGTAACYAELADARYFADIDDPSEALATARLAIEAAPDSEKGRTLVSVVRDRMVTYYLSGGNEEAARNLLAELIPDASARQLQAELGARYSRLAHGSARRDPGALPRRFAQWMDRSLELNPAYEAQWDVEESAYVLGRALQMGADMRIVLGFVERVLETGPQASSFQRLRDQLRTSLGLPPVPTPASQPASRPQVL